MCLIDVLVYWVASINLCEKVFEFKYIGAKGVKGVKAVKAVGVGVGLVIGVFEVEIKEDETTEEVEMAKCDSICSRVILFDAIGAREEESAGMTRDFTVSSRWVIVIDS